MKFLALVLVLGGPGNFQLWTLSPGLTTGECYRLLDVPQDLLLSTFGSEYAADGFNAVMAAPQTPWLIQCRPI